MVLYSPVVHQHTVQYGWPHPADVTEGRNIGKQIRLNDLSGGIITKVNCVPSDTSTAAKWLCLESFKGSKTKVIVRANVKSTGVFRAFHIGFLA